MHGRHPASGGLHLRLRLGAISDVAHQGHSVDRVWQHLECDGLRRLAQGGGLASGGQEQGRNRPGRCQAGGGDFRPRRRHREDGFVDCRVGKGRGANSTWTTRGSRRGAARHHPSPPQVGRPLRLDAVLRALPRARPRLPAAPPGRDLLPLHARERPESARKVCTLPRPAPSGRDHAGFWEIHARHLDQHRAAFRECGIAVVVGDSLHDRTAWSDADGAYLRDFSEELVARDSGERGVQTYEGFRAEVR
mmetsp:Transcript_10471/g.27708  ORF Transcript_10471/g.27708 Transcript_10471/m.27708 type:complete len:249 (+) Transcript_10471:344-1090(+)